LSKESNSVVSARAKKLGIDVVQGTGLKTKIEVLKSWLDAKGLKPEDILFMGNDLNDLDCMALDSFSVSPASVCTQVKNIADKILFRNGGCGAVRECLEFVAATLGQNF